MKRALLLIGIGAVALLTVPRSNAAAPAILKIDNQSQYALQQVRLHEGEAYSDADNILAAPLPAGHGATVEDGGQYYVTVFREENRGGKMLAFTTARPINLGPGGQYKLIVFDESFRLIEETPATQDAGGCSCQTTR